MPPASAPRRFCRWRRPGRTRRRSRSTTSRRPANWACKPFDATVGELREWIDWGPFFTAWELRGSYPQILDDPDKGEPRRKLFDEANALLDEIEARRPVHPARRLRPLPRPRRRSTTSYSLPRWRRATANRRRSSARRDASHAAPADPRRRRASPTAPWRISWRRPPTDDHLGAFVVTIHGAEALAERPPATSTTTTAPSWPSRSPTGWRRRTPSAARLRAAQRLGLRARRGPEHGDDLVRERYRGIRPAPGYPAQPDHTEKVALFDLLDATAPHGCRAHRSTSP